MTALQTIFVALAACVTVLISSAIIGDAISNQQPTGYSEAGRWVIHATQDKGWLLLDTQTGKICQIPNASNSDTSIHCSDTPGAL